MTFKEPMMPHRSFWLEEALKDSSPLPALRGTMKSDIAIIGGGYVGLWTAIQIKRLDPGALITILEKDICGGGASGRNGGFILSWWPKISSLVKLCGKSEGLSIAKDSEIAIGEIQDFCVENNIEAQFRRSPWLWTATSSAQIGAWESVLRVCDNLQVNVFQRLAPEEIARRSGSGKHLSGIVDNTAAIVQPALLVQGLKKVALNLGVQIFENTTVQSFTRSRPVKINVLGGEVISEKLIIANNAWAAGISELSRSIVAITSDMIVSAPAKQDLERIGWTGRECVTDSQTMVDYYHVTKDFRIAFGKGGWGIAYGGKIGSDFDRNLKRARIVENDFRLYYPKLKHVPITHDWCGPIDRTPNSLPLLGSFVGNEQIIYGVGWSGNGVGPSVIGGKVLASLALGRNDKWAKYPLVGRSAGTFPPEPIRYLGAHVVRAAVASKEKAEMRGLRPSTIATSLSKLAPSGLEDKD